MRIYSRQQKKRNIIYRRNKQLTKKIWEHKQKLVEGFTKRYNINMLVYYEQTENIYSAIQREKQLKKWERKWKLNLIEKNNPQWRDLYSEL